MAKTTTKTSAKAKAKAKGKPAKSATAKKAAPKVKTAKAKAAKPAKAAKAAKAKRTKTPTPNGNGLTRTGRSVTRLTDHTLGHNGQKGHPVLVNGKTLADLNRGTGLTVSYLSRLRLAKRSPSILAVQLLMLETGLDFPSVMEVFGQHATAEFKQVSERLAGAKVKADPKTDSLATIPLSAEDENRASMGLD